MEQEIHVVWQQAIGQHEGGGFGGQYPHGTHVEGPRLHHACRALARGAAGGIWTRASIEAKFRTQRQPARRKTREWEGDDGTGTGRKLR